MHYLRTERVTVPLHWLAILPLLVQVQQYSIVAYTNTICVYLLPTHESHQYRSGLRD